MNKYYKHELVDRSYMIMDSFDRFISNHPKFKKLPKKLKKKCNKVISLLWDVYQDVSNLK